MGLLGSIIQGTFTNGGNVKCDIVVVVVVVFVLAWVGVAALQGVVCGHFALATGCSVAVP